MIEFFKSLARIGRGRTNATEVSRQVVLPPLQTPPGRGWQLWAISPVGDNPYIYDEVETWHASWGDKIARESPRSMNPTRNIHGLWWRPVGRMP